MAESRCFQIYTNPFPYVNLAILSLSFFIVLIVNDTDLFVTGADLILCVQLLLYLNLVYWNSFPVMLQSNKFT